MRAVITGATGMIGEALIQRFVKEKIQVLAICHKGSQKIKNISAYEGVKVVEADLSDFKDMDCPEEKYDVFYHLAWMGTIGKDRNDMNLQTDNIKYTLNAVHLAARLGCHTFIGAGSQAEYGRCDRKLKPDTPAFPETGYGMAKLCAGQMSRAECEQLGLNHIWVRILSVYGPSGSADTMITGTLLKMLKGQRAEFTPAEQIWDYLYSDDAAEALYLLGEKGIHGKVYVLGSGEEKPLKEYIKILTKEAACYLGTVPEVRLGAVPYGEKQVMYLSADISELEKDTGFVPTVSFEMGIKKLIEKDLC